MEENKRDTRTLTLRNADVDLHRRLRPSVLFQLLQEAAIAHTTMLGAGREKTLDRGFLWVVTMQRAEIARWPVYDETITLTTWPGKNMHVLFPRYYTVTDGDGAVLIRASALWVLMDQSSRGLVFPEEHGVEIPGLVTGEECALPRPPKALPTDTERSFTVPYSYVDLNGHMNNTRYLDLVQDTLPAPWYDRPPTEILVEHASEARLGQTIRLRLGLEQNTWFILGEGEKRIFRMVLRYD